MIALPAEHRWATLDDASAMAELVNMAGEGMPLYLWERAAEPGETAWDIGRRRARRDAGAYSWRNTVIREIDGRVAAALIGYPLPDEPDPIDPDMPAMFMPLQELENLAPGTWYVNILATYPEHRGKGCGAALLEIAGTFAAASLRRGLSLIVSDANTGARRLYERLGYTERATRPMVKESWENDGENWVLMVRGL